MSPENLWLIPHMRDSNQLSQDACWFERGIDQFFKKPSTFLPFNKSFNSHCLRFIFRTFKGSCQAPGTVFRSECIEEFRVVFDHSPPRVIAIAGTINMRSKRLQNIDVKHFAISKNSSSQKWEKPQFLEVFFSAPPSGLEPETLWLTVRCSNQLS